MRIPTSVGDQWGFALIKSRPLGRITIAQLPAVMRGWRSEILKLDGKSAADITVTRTQYNRFSVSLAGGYVALRKEILEIGNSIDMHGPRTGRGDRLTDLKP